MSNRAFSHLYVEESLLGTTRAETIVRRFSRAVVVTISDYRELFMRPRQEWRLQKSQPSLILAERRGEFLYPGSPVTPHFGFQHFFYNTLALNCLYDCSYCYLQGMLPSAHLVLFLNVERFIEAALAQLEQTSPMYLCLSYDTDLLPLESFVPYSKLWLQTVRAHADLSVELRTKSASLRALHGELPCDRFILAWTLSPQSAIDRFEKRTPSLASRLASLRTAIEAGWKIRVCLDPVIEFPGWEEDYRALLSELFTLPHESVADISVGSLRMSKQHWRQFAHVRPDHRALGQVEQQKGYMVAPSLHRDRVLSIAQEASPVHWAGKLQPAHPMDI